MYVYIGMGLLTGMIVAPRLAYRLLNPKAVRIICLSHKPKSAYVSLDALDFVKNRNLLILISCVILI